MEKGNEPINPIYGLNNQLFENDEHAQHFLGNKVSGLTKREYFAGLAMQGLLAQDSWASEKVLAENAIIYADELLKQLEK
jgi:hypothetical protein